MRYLLLSIMILAVGFLAACGDDDNGDGNGNGADAPDPALVQQGQGIVQSQCITCHSTDGREVVGPTFLGLYGSTVELEDGSTVTADAAYIRESIYEPNAKIVAGFMPVMPSFDGTLSDDEVDAIIAYIQTLEDENS
jgi:cytochrome c oxidase subunit II